MMYILYNSDGSIKSKYLNEYIQQGNNNVNSIFVSIADHTIDDLTFYVIFPNGIASAESTGTDSTQTIGGTSYTGKIFYLSSTHTSMQGQIKVIFTATDDDDNVLATYTVVLTVNDGIGSNPLFLTQTEYNNLLNSFLKLTGGTLTGNLVGTSANFTTSLKLNNKNVATTDQITKLYLHVMDLFLDGTSSSERYCYIISTYNSQYTIGTILGLSNIQKMVQIYLSDNPAGQFQGFGKFATELTSGGASIYFGSNDAINPNTTVQSDTVTEL